MVDRWEDSNNSVAQDQLMDKATLNLNLIHMVKATATMEVKEVLRSNLITPCTVAMVIPKVDHPASVR